MTITEQKAAQRKAGIAARRALSDTERTRSNAALCARIMALDCFKKAENILLYAAFGGEADLSALAVEAARQGKGVLEADPSVYGAGCSGCGGG